MNLDKTAKALKKINRLYELISDLGEASATERDLLRAYAKELYESLSDEEVVEVKTPEPPKVEAEKEAPPAPIEKTIPPEPTVVDEKPAPAAVATATSDSKEVATAALTGFSPKMLEIFEVNEVNELSDKLSQSPIKDLTKAMGINEKIFTVNELFDGNQEEFNSLMLALNGLDNYSDAKAVLMKSAASKYDWDAAEKEKKARNFIKLVQRRYK